MSQLNQRPTDVSEMHEHEAMTPQQMTPQQMTPQQMTPQQMTPHQMTPHQMAGHAGMDHSSHAGHGDHVGQFRRLFWIMLIVAVPVVVFSNMFAMILSYQLPTLPFVAWISPLLGTLMYVWGGWPFLNGAVMELKARKPGMMLLIALAITVAFLASSGASLGLLDHQLNFWWELALLIVIMLLGH